MCKRERQNRWFSTDMIGRRITTSLLPDGDVILDGRLVSENHRTITVRRLSGENVIVIPKQNIAWITSTA